MKPPAGDRAGWRAGVRPRAAPAPAGPSRRTPARTGSADETGSRPGRAERRRATADGHQGRVFRSGCGSASSSSCVYGCRGLVSNYAVAPASASRPAYITHSRRAIADITPRSCVITITAIPRSWRSRSSSRSMPACTVTSSTVVGSWATGSRGSPPRRSRSRCAAACRRKSALGRSAAPAPGPEYGLFSGPGAPLLNRAPRRAVCRLPRITCLRPDSGRAAVDVSVRATG
jgi:hypothetical protein